MTKTPPMFFSMQTNFIELSVDMSMVGDISYLSKSNAGSSTFLKLTSTGYIEYYQDGVGQATAP